MFEGQKPLGDDDRPQWPHIAAGLGALALVWLLTAIGRRPPRRHADVIALTVRPLLEFAPAIVLALIARFRASTPGTAAAIVIAVAGAVTSQLLGHPVPAIAGAVIGAYLFLSVKVLDQWEKCVVLRFGRYHALRGPGMFRIVPIIDTIGGLVDERVRTTAVHAEAALTRDAVPMHVDAVIFWVVWDVEKAVLEVQDFDTAVGLVAQTALLEAIGRRRLGDMISERAALGRDLQATLAEKTAAWGVTLQSVEIRDLRLPAGLQDAMSRQAQAERERQARIIFGNTEVELAGRFAEASVVYQHDPTALHLRAMNMLYEAIKEKGRMVVVPTSALTKRTGRTERAVSRQ